MTSPPRRRPGLDAEIIVVGGGPAGAGGCHHAGPGGTAGRGAIDKATFPRDKCCGDGLTVAALRRLEQLGLDPALVPSWEPVDEAVVVGPAGRQLRLPLPRNAGQFAASARRVDLDAALLARAGAAGALVIDGCAVSGVRADRGGDEVVVEVARRLHRAEPGDGARLRSRYVIAADGMWSPVRKALGLGQSGYLGDWQAGRQYFHGVGPGARKLWVWFEPDMAPGYAWSFPLPDGTANVGYGVVRFPGQAASPLRGQRVDLLSRPHIAAVLGPDAIPAGPWKSWPIPARIGATTLAGLGGRVLFVGDAARACDPMTGEGIAQALETADLAARAISAAGPWRPEAAAARYQRQIRWGMARRRAPGPGPLQDPRPPERRSRRRCASPTAAHGRGASSPAGCSRTLPGQSW